MAQTIITIVIVAVAVFWAVRRVVRTTRGKGGCNCGCADCPHSGKGCNEKQETTVDKSENRPQR